MEKLNKEIGILYGTEQSLWGEFGTFESDTVIKKQRHEAQEEKILARKAWEDIKYT